MKNYNFYYLRMNDKNKWFAKKNYIFEIQRKLIIRENLIPYLNQENFKFG
jgi:hypothetical protein